MSVHVHVCMFKIMYMQIKGGLHMYAIKYAYFGDMFFKNIM